MKKYETRNERNNFSSESGKEQIIKKRIKKSTAELKWVKPHSFSFFFFFHFIAFHFDKSIHSRFHGHTIWFLTLTTLFLFVICEQCAIKKNWILISSWYCINKNLFRIFQFGWRACFVRLSTLYLESVETTFFSSFVLICLYNSPNF